MPFYEGLKRAGMRKKLLESTGISLRLGLRGDKATIDLRWLITHYGCDLCNPKISIEMSSVKIASSNLPPCSISLLDGRLIIGTYDLNKSTGVRTGSLDMYGSDLQLLQSTPTSSAILDTKIYDNKLYTADSTGKISAWDPSNLALIDQFQVKPAETLITQIEPQNNNTLAATTTEGELLVFDLEAQKIKYEAKLHDLEAWTVSWHTNDTLLTGGDDRLLTYTDLRIPYTLWKLKPHEAGVTSILPDSAISGDSNRILTGGYDDMLNLFDLRTRRVSETTQLSGGVWRLLPNPSKSRILACCMYGGLQILDPSEFGRVEAELTNHESMVYGGVWLDDSTGITCSFYDKMLQKWNVK